MDSNTNKQGKKNYYREQQTLSQMLPKIIYIDEVEMFTSEVHDPYARTASA